MVNKSKILSDLSKIAVDAMSTFSSLRKEIETMVSLRVNKVINRMNLVMSLFLHNPAKLFMRIYSL